MEKWKSCCFLESLAFGWVCFEAEILAEPTDLMIFSIWHRVGCEWTMEFVEVHISYVGDDVFKDSYVIVARRYIYWKKKIKQFPIVLYDYILSNRVFLRQDEINLIKFVHYINYKQ